MNIGCAAFGCFSRWTMHGFVVCSPWVCNLELRARNRVQLWAWVSLEYKVHPERPLVSHATLISCLAVQTIREMWARLDVADADLAMHTAYVRDYLPSRLEEDGLVRLLNLESIRVTRLDISNAPHPWNEALPPERYHELYIQPRRKA